VAAASARRSWGNPEEIAERLNEYAALGVDTFILSGPHLEEAYRIAELLLPFCRRIPPAAGSVSLDAMGV